jgi:signal transduction histidine kinase
MLSETMTLSTFILENLEPILTEWESFARTILPASDGMSSEELRDDAEQMLITIARDMATAQSAAAQLDKSRGRQPRGADDGDTASEVHAGDRLHSGFNLNELVGEYRALRATVIRLWTSEMGDANRANLDELTRFNEALDQAECEAVARYTSRVERARDLLLGALGHDLRNPLSAVAYSARYLLQADKLDGGLTKAVTRIVTAAARMQAMIRDLLDFAQTRLGAQLPMARASMNMGGACRAAIEEIGAFHPERTLVLDSTGDLGGSWDAERIGQMLSNLIINAVKHGAPDGPIRVSAFALDADVGVSVHNEGPPIPKHMWRRIFEPLAHGTVEERNGPRAERSLGLGLYIACEIAKSHGGSLKLTSSAEDGTTFTAVLPRC